jgi:hypothetical protein
MCTSCYTEHSGAGCISVVVVRWQLVVCAAYNCMYLLYVLYAASALATRTLCDTALSTARDVVEGIWCRPAVQ